MSQFRPLYKIPMVGCLRENYRYIACVRDKCWLPVLKEQIESQHAWCNIFCKEFCTRETVESCHQENTMFCKNNCQKHCFHLGPTPTKTQ